MVDNKDVFANGLQSRNNDEEALVWAAIQRVPTYDRLRTGLLKSVVDVDVRKLTSNDKQQFVERNFKVAEEDNEKFLKKIRDRINKAGLQLPTVEVRFEKVRIEADCYVGTRALPTLLNTSRNFLESALGLCGVRLAKRAILTILKDVSGIIKPSRMTLLVGPPSSGKTTLLQALAGKLDPTLNVQGQVSYNGYKLDEFVPRKTAAYVSQNDVHLGDLTVKETFDFSARFQGTGTRSELLAELLRREKEAGITPDPDVDLFMKATAIEGVESSLITDYILKLLGLDVCKDTVVGDQMRRGLSGGQMKRVTTGEMIVGPARVLFMDDISTGLDSSTTHQIVKCMQQITHLTEATTLISLLQPDPETFDLFDDIILLSDGQIVYQGPREHVLEFFESCGFKCPERKATADFLQEVTSKKDQEQYWADGSKPYEYISLPEFASKFKAFHVGIQLENGLNVPYDKAKCHKAALVFKKRTIPALQILRISIDREMLVIKRTLFIFIFKAIQIIVLAFITSTVFLRTTLHITYDGGSLYMTSIIFSAIANTFNGFAELSMAIMRLPVFYKQRDLLLYPAWAYTLPNFLLRVPIAVFESAVWTVVTYFNVGYAPEASRFFKQLLVVFLIHQVAAALFRLMAGLCRSMIIAYTAGLLAVLILFLLGGFILPKGILPIWWSWAHWLSPLSYAFDALAANEMLAQRWMDRQVPGNTTKLGMAFLDDFDVNTHGYWFWIRCAALVGFTVLYNVLFTFSLMCLNSLGKPQAIIYEEIANKQSVKEETKEREKPKTKILDNEPSSREMQILRISSQSNAKTRDGVAMKKGMIMPFTPLSMSFDSVNYYVDMPIEMKLQGVTQDRLQLLKEVTGAFRPGVLTALMGVSGAGKTTLMDVLAGRKTSGYIEGDIRISGFPTNQETFARISGYCEQTDIHSPQVTVGESLIFSAFLRLPKEVSDQEKMVFVEEVMDLVELNNLKNAIVGLPGITGLSTEQRKRLTIAVELVANPSIIFLDEPTSGLDARAAAIVMRTVRNTVDTGRTVVCTIHQPSTDIFEAFDELLLMKIGGKLIYSGPLGWHSHKMIEYFESIAGVPQIREKQNPAAWMLEASSLAVEFHLGIDFAEHYKSSSLFQQTKALVEDLSTPPEGTTDLYFPNKYSQSKWGQFKSCLWKQWWTYWRSPDYNFARYIFTLAAALILGTLYWQLGNKRESSFDLTMTTGALLVAVMFLGINNSFTVQPVIAIERTVFYRERAAGMYSALPYALAQVIVEIPYILVQTTYYSLMVYPMVSFEWTVAKFFWFYFITFCSFLYFTYYGMMTVSITPNQEIAAIVASAFYAIFALFSGFFIPRPRLPKWWKWYSYICPLAWSIYGLIVTQFGDIEDTIKVPGIELDPSIKSYIQDHFDYDVNFKGPIAAILVAFSAFFVLIFIFCIRYLNFQQR